MKQVEKEFDEHLDEYIGTSTFSLTYPGFLFMPKLLKFRDKIAIVACDEYSAWIVPYSEIEEKVNSIKEELEDKSLNDEKIERINNNLAKLHHSILMVLNTEYGNDYLDFRKIADMFEDNTAFFRNENGRLKMYFGKEAFKKSFNEYSFDKVGRK